ncbi:MAG TPA: thiamine pyrophosphate-binding protein [Mycobacteriales bacterium]|nr:thiamine pyrophosphate-binding protein [Mycobacteriales bacterium]
MRVAEVVGRTLAGLGVDHVFGVVGSGNFHVTNALVAGGARFVAARHEGGAATMADAYGRVSGRVGVLSVHQGCGLTNAVTGITEAAKSRTPMVVLAAEAASSAVRSNFRIDQSGLVAAVGALPERVHSPASAVSDTLRAYRRAVVERRTVVLNLPLDVQAAEAEEDGVAARTVSIPTPPRPSDTAVSELADVLAGARRPVFLAGRGARHAGRELAELAERCGALLATSAVARGLFHGEQWSLDVSGGFASPLAAELITGADVLVGWGCALNMWTLRHGRLVGRDALVVQVDLDPDALGAHQPVQLGIVGDSAQAAAAVDAELAARGHASRGYRDERLRARLAADVRWRDVPYDDDGDGDRIDPRTLSIALDDVLPAERVVAVDSGNFMGYPSAYLSVPDEQGFCFTQAFQSIGLGLATATGAALARPDRLPVAALGDGGAMMGIAELDTVVRLGIPMAVVVYNDAAYGAEVHHFGPDGHPLDTVQFPDTDVAAVGRGFGCAGVTVRKPDDLAALSAWLDGPRDRPIVVDAKVTSRRGAWWLEEAFRGH